MSKKLQGSSGSMVLVGLPGVVKENFFSLLRRILLLLGREHGFPSASICRDSWEVRLMASKNAGLLSFALGRTVNFRVLAGLS